VDVVRSFTDPRIRLIQHERNQGRCPARNTALAAARGHWFVFFDCDDELLPGALQTIHEDAIAVAPDVAALRYACVSAEKIVSPDPPYPRETWTYEQYLRSLEASAHGLGESLPCTRTSTFPELAFPEGHAEEGLYHLDLARRWRMKVSPDVVRRYHHDAPNQVTRPDFRRALRFAPDASRNADIVLERHGQALRHHAPTVYAQYVRAAALYHFMAGNRRAGLRYASRSMRLVGPSLKLALIVTFGLAGGAPLAVFQAFQGMLRRSLFHQR
jgi:glycosyltransferase involved in cell wall biosynthesis